MDLEEKIDSNYDEHHRLKERVVAIDHANTSLERHVQTIDDARGRKRKASISAGRCRIMSPESNCTTASSVGSETTSSSGNISPQPPSPVNLPVPSNPTVVSPRSSGVLIHRATSRHGSVGQNHDPRQVPTAALANEPRSSGFLSIDLAQRMRRKQPSPTGSHEKLLPVGGNIPDHQSGKSVSITSAPPTYKKSPGAIPVSGLLSTSPTRPGFDQRSLKKRRQQNGMMALDVLANASVERPLA